MRSIVVLLLSAWMLTGCAFIKGLKSAPPPATNAPPDKIITTPETILVGKVVRVNYAARFAILNFPIGNLPALGTHLGAYRQGLKVGEIKVTGPQQDDNTAGDIVSGEVQNGDELRGN